MEGTRFFLAVPLLTLVGCRAPANSTASSDASAAPASVASTDQTAARLQIDASRCPTLVGLLGDTHETLAAQGSDRAREELKRLEEACASEQAEAHASRECLDAFTDPNAKSACRYAPIHTWDDVTRTTTIAAVRLYHAIVRSVDERRTNGQSAPWCEPSETGPLSGRGSDLACGLGEASACPTSPAEKAMRARKFEADAPSWRAFAWLPETSERALYFQVYASGAGSEDQPCKLRVRVVEPLSGEGVELQAFGTPGGFSFDSVSPQRDE